MGRGARPGNEFIQREQQLERRRVEREPAPGQSGYTTVFPEMRVARTVMRDQDGLTDDWHMFLDDVGERNYGIGRAHALGSAAVVMVPAKEMGRMLDERYDKYRSRDTARDIHRRLADGITAFAREATIRAYDDQTTEQEIAYNRLQSAVRFSTISHEIEADDVAELVYQEGVGFIEKLAAELPQIAPQLPMEAGSFAVKEVALFGKTGYGLDLSTNDQLYEERSALLNHLRTEERLDTSRLAADGWTPHATIFTFEDHISNAPLDYQAGMPKKIGLNAVKPIVSKGF